ENLHTCLKYLAQGRTCARYGILFEDTSVEMASLLDSLGAFFYNDGQHDEAISYYQHALHVYDLDFGAKHINSAGTINNLGNVYDSQGKYYDAISCYERALEIYDRAFGAEHVKS